MLASTASKHAHFSQLFMGLAGYCSMQDHAALQKNLTYRNDWPVLRAEGSKTLIHGRLKSWTLPVTIVKLCWRAIAAM